MVAPLNKDRSQEAMEATRQNTDNENHFKPPCIPHSDAVILMDIALDTKDPNGVGDTIHIFLFLEIYPSVGSEAALLTRKWDAILGGGSTLN